MIRVFLAYILFALSAVTTMAADYPSCSNMRDGPICETSFNGFYYIGYSSENTSARRNNGGVYYFPNEKSFLISFHGLRRDKLIKEYAVINLDGLAGYQKIISGEKTISLTRPNIKNLANKNNKVLFGKIWKQWNSLTFSDRKKLQSKLAIHDLYRSKIDGVWGPRTLAGILAFNLIFDNELKPSNAISARLLLQSIINSKRYYFKNCSAFNLTACRDAAICANATDGKSKPKWLKGTVSAKRFVSEAKKRKLSCNILPDTAFGRCDQSITTCSNKDLCETATYSISGTRKWKVGNYAKFADEAKRRGQSCGVKQQTASAPKVTKPTTAYQRCDQSISTCSNKDLCETATYSISGTRKWKVGNYAKFADEAKRRGQSCGVTGSKTLCDDDAQKCTIVELCQKSTFDKNGQKLWLSTPEAITYVDFAKSMGLTCGVKPKPVVVAKAPTCEDDPTKCSVIELCQQATGTNSSGEKFWRMDAALQTYVVTAKSTGVTCGVVSKVIETAKLETCENTPSKCSLAELCQRAISFETGKLGWTTAVNDAPYVQFAKNSGMTCGVQEDLVAAVPEQKQVEPPAPKKVLKYPNRKALVIGNANYVDQTPLKNPINDAKAVAAKLEQIGFEVTYEENLKVREFGRTITDFEQALQGSDIGLFYYAGHGIEVEKQNYLIPIDAEIRTPRDVRFETVMLEDAISASLNTGKLSMVLVDACRDNPFAGQLGSGTRSIARGLSVVEVETGPVNQIVSFAAASGEVAEDGSGNNSPYATALIELLDEPNLEVGKMFRLLGERVSEMTGGKQQPVKRDNLRGEDIFLVVSD